MSTALFSFLRHPLRGMVVLGLCLVILPSAAHARLVVCSAATTTVLTAVARWEGRRFVARGWYPVAPGACRTLIRRQLPRGGKYYVSIRSAKRVIVRSAAGGGRLALCVPRQGRFAVSSSRSKVRVCKRTWQVYPFGLHRPRSGRIQLSISPPR